MNCSWAAVDINMQDFSGLTKKNSQLVLKSVTGTARNLYLVITTLCSNCPITITILQLQIIIITTSLVYMIKKKINNQIANYYYYKILLQQITI